MKTAKCSSIDTVLHIDKCKIESQNGKTGASFNSTLLTDVSTLSLHGLFYTERKGSLILLMDLKNINLCSLFTDSLLNGASPIVPIFRDLIAVGGKIPEKCPIMKNTQLVYNMLNMDPTVFPYLPEMKYKLVFLFAANNIPNSLVINVTGVVVHEKNL